MLEEVSLSPAVPDRFVWRWTADGAYSASSAYKVFFVGMASMLGAKELWRSRAPPKIKLFFCLALHGRIWTADRRKRHHLQDTDTCVLCDQCGETVDHLLRDPESSAHARQSKSSRGSGVRPAISQTRASSLVSCIVVPRSPARS